MTGIERGIDDDQEGTIPRIIACFPSPDDPDQFWFDFLQPLVRVGATSSASALIVQSALQSVIPVLCCKKIEGEGKPGGVRSKGRQRQQGRATSGGASRTGPSRAELVGTDSLGGSKEVATNERAGWFYFCWAANTRTSRKRKIGEGISSPLESRNGKAKNHRLFRFIGVLTLHPVITRKRVSPHSQQNTREIRRKLDV